MTDPQCACKYSGRLDTDGHRRHHRLWEATSPTADDSPPQAHDLADLYRLHDTVVAALHGGPLPKMTPGAQAIIVLDRQERDQ